MIMENRLSETIYTAGRNAYFDRCAKNLIADPQILSRILSECVPEYKGLTPDEIESQYLTEGSVMVSSEPLYRDVMRPGEDASINEGTVVYDILVHLKAPSGESEIGLYVNLEAQSSFSMSLCRRAKYYASRLISSQYGKTFTNSEYGRLEKIYSIWICFNPPKALKGSVHSFGMQPVGKVDDVAMKYYNGLDAERIVFVHLGDDSGRRDIAGLLWTLLGSHLEAEGRKRSLSEKFGIRLTEEIGEGVEAMCDISVGFYRNARRDGLAEGRAEGLELGRKEGREEGLAEGRTEKSLEHIISLMHNGNMSVEKAMDLLSVPKEERAVLLEKLGISQ